MKTILKKAISLLLALVMMVGVLPISTFAAVEKPNWDVADEKSTPKGNEFWNLPQNTRLRRTGNVAEPFKNNSLSYVGSFINEDGREVIRIRYTSHNSSFSTLWKRLIIKLNDEFNDLVDWNYMSQNKKGGIGKNAGGDTDNFTEFMQFTQLASSQSGSRNTYVVNLDDAGLNGAAASRKVPIDFILKKGQTIRGLKEAFVQMRLMDTNYSEVYTASTGDLDSYDAYTWSTNIPLGIDYAVKTLPNIAGEDSSPYNATNVMVDYERKIIQVPEGGKNVQKEVGLLTVKQRQQKTPSETRGVEDTYALRNAFDTSFKNVLKPVDDSGTIADVFLLTHKEEIFYPDPSTPTGIRNDSVQRVTQEYINDEGGISFIEVASSKYKQIPGIRTVVTANKFRNVVMNQSLTSNQGFFTAIRYYVDPDKMEKLVGDDGYEAFQFFTSFVINNPDGINEFKTSLSQDKVLQKGDNIVINFPESVGRSAKFNLEIGTAPYSYTFNEAIKYTGGGPLQPTRDKQYSIEMPVGMTIKAGQPITLRMKKGTFDGQEIKVTIGNETLNATEKQVSNLPMIVQNSVSYSAGSINRTLFAPKIDEIFTDSEKFTGHSYYEQADAFMDVKKEETKKIKVSEAGEEVILTDGKPYTGYKFEFVGQDMPTSPLEKDMPISFRNQDTFKRTTISTPVVEQVQAKVDFVYDNDKKIEKIAPLNKNYKYLVEDPEKPEIEVGADNPDYVASGFAGDQIKVSGEDVNLSLTNYRDETVEKTYKNVVNHNGDTYDVSKPEEKAEFLKRQFPSTEMYKELNNTNKGLKVIGWTTKKLEDDPKEQVGGKTAQEKYEDLKLQGETAYIGKLTDWADAENNAKIFDEKSPIDKNRIVYAVWGPAANIVLHSNNKENPNEEVVVRIPLNQEDKDYTKRQLEKTTGQNIDKEKSLIKKIPMVPYLDEKGDEKLKDFTMEGHTFIGWTLKENKNDNTSDFLAGNNNERIGQLSQGIAEDLKGLKNTEAISYLAENPTIAALPNGFDLLIPENYEEILAKGEDIDLYANYRKYFDITVTPQFKAIDKENGEPGEYTDTDKKMDSIRVALLYRTAVTGYDKPTVHSGANYNPILSDDAIKTYDGSGSLKWTLPGFDRLGQRRSYVSVVVPEGKDDVYKNFSTNWSALGITTYFKNSGDSVDKKAPKNLYRGEDFDPYGVGLAKTQIVDDGVDVFTSATARKPILRRTEVTSYEIVMTNSPENIPTPVIDEAKVEDKKISIKYGPAEEKADIKALKLKIADADEIILNKSGDSFSGSGYTGTVQDGKLVITANPPIDLTQNAEKWIEAKFVKSIGGEDKESAVGKAQIGQQLTSNTVTDMNQVKKEGDKPVIEFRIPNPILNQVVKDTVYTAQKWDAGTNAWVDVGKTTIDKQNQGGQQKTIALTGKVDHKDVIRIKAEEPNKKPSDSTNTGDAVYEDGQGVYVSLDLKGPTGAIKAEDSTFRTHINISGELDKVPSGDVKLIIDTDGNDKPNEADRSYEFTTRDKLVEFLMTVPREDNMPKMWLHAVDNLGNEENTEVTYNGTYQFALELQSPRSRRNYMRFKPDMDKASVTVTVKRGKVQVHKETFENLQKGKFTKVTLKDGFKFKVGDIVIIEGVAMDSGHKHTTNPFETTVSR